MAINGTEFVNPPEAYEQALLEDFPTWAYANRDPYGVNGEIDKLNYLVVQYKRNPSHSLKIDILALAKKMGYL